MVHFRNWESPFNAVRTIPNGATIQSTMYEVSSTMNLGWLRIFAVFILVFPVCSHAQSLGDVARQIRAERQAKKTPHAKVITNDEIAASTARDEPAAGVPDATHPEVAAKDAGAEAENSAPVKGNGKQPKDPARERDDQELERQARTQEINKSYTDKIAGLRTQINTAQSDLAKLQRDQVESTLQFQRTLGVSPTPGGYEEQQRMFTTRIEETRNLITSLNSQLEDAREAARHAGVPHASD